MFNGIKEQFGKYFLARELAAHPRPKNTVKFNFTEIKNVGILFDSSDKEEFELVKKYVNYLKEMKKRVKAIGYFSSSQVPALTYSKLEYDFFTPKQLNWHLKPSDPFINNFIEEEWDVLIDLNIYDRFPLKYIASVCRAKFRLGKYSKADEKLYDMMIETAPDKSLKYFLRQVDTYLFMINRKEPEITNPDNN